MTTQITLITALAAALAIGCHGKASKDDCTKLGDHVIEVVNHGQPSDNPTAKLAMDKIRQREVDYCTDKMSPSEVKCALAGTSGAEIDACTK